MGSCNIIWVTDVELEYASLVLTMGSMIMTSKQPSGHLRINRVFSGKADWNLSWKHLSWKKSPRMVNSVLINVLAPWGDRTFPGTVMTNLVSVVMLMPWCFKHQGMSINNIDFIFIILLQIPKANVLLIYEHIWYVNAFESNKLSILRIKMSWNLPCSWGQFWIEWAWADLSYVAEIAAFRRLTATLSGSFCVMLGPASVLLTIGSVIMACKLSSGHLRINSHYRGLFRAAMQKGIGDP